MSNLIEITEKIGVLIDLKYATDDNFTGKSVYNNAKCFLHKDAYDLLLNSIEIADKLGYKIRIFDAYRPAEAQYKLWEHTPDENFLAHPDKGSPHSRGVAIDLTLVDKEKGFDLDMGTEFDAFTPLSYHTEVKAISKEALKNRAILLGIMSASGWDFYKNEWWHYQLFNSKQYNLIFDKDFNIGIM